MRRILICCLLALLSACGARDRRCEGRLRPINPAASAALPGDGGTPTAVER